jgi:autotransporter-associated beta strand protein
VDGGTFRFGSFGAPTGTNAVTINFSSGTVASIDATNRTLGLAYNLGKTGGSTVTFGQASGGTGTLTLNGAGTLLGNTTVETVQDTTLGGALDGAFALTKTGAATLIINQNQTWSGGTIISAGTLKMSGNKTLASGSNMTVGASGTWRLDGTSQTLGELTGSGLVTSTWATSGFDTLTLGSGDASSSFSGTISGGDGTSVRGIALTKTGTGTLTLSGDNSYSGITTVNTGVLGISHANALGATGADARTQIAGNENTGRVELSGGITTGETFQIAMRQNAALDAPALSNLSGDNTVTGDIQGITGGSRVNIESQAALLTLAGNLSQTDGTGSRTWQLMGAGNGLVSGVISNGTATNLGIIKTGAGTWTFSNTNTYTGNTSVNEGTLALGAAGSIATSPAVNLAAGGTLDTSAQASFAMTGTQPFAFGLDSSGAGSSGQLVADGLDISAAVVTFNITGILDDPAYILATYTNGSLDGTQFASVTPPTGYTLDYAHNGGTQIALVTATRKPPIPTILPTLDASGANFIFNFTRREESANDTTQVFQYGDDLSGWTSLSITAPTAPEVALGTPSGGLQTVTVTIPKSPGPAAKLFGRLQVSQP